MSSTSHRRNSFIDLLQLLLKLVLLGMVSIDHHRFFPSPSTNVTPAEFPKFPKFPLEIQAMIFEFAAANDEPRFLELFTKTREEEQQRDLKVRHQVPALLHVSREARRWAKKYYIKLMGTTRCYLDPRKDVVFMQDSIVPKLYNSWIQHRAKTGQSYSMELEKRVRYVVVGGENEYPSLADLTNCGFSNLEKIVLQKQPGGLNSRQQAHLLQNSWVRNDQTPQDVWRYRSVCPDQKPEVEFLDKIDLNKETILQTLGFHSSLLADNAEHEDDNSQSFAAPHAENQEINDLESCGVPEDHSASVLDSCHVNLCSQHQYNSVPHQHRCNHNTQESENIPNGTIQLQSHHQHNRVPVRHSNSPHYNVAEVIQNHNEFHDPQHDTHPLPVRYLKNPQYNMLDDIVFDDKDPGSSGSPETAEDQAAKAEIIPLRDSDLPNPAQPASARTISISSLLNPTWDTSTLPTPTISYSAQGYIEYFRWYTQSYHFDACGLPVYPQLQFLPQFGAP